MTTEATTDVVVDEQKPVVETPAVTVDPKVKVPAKTEPEAIQYEETGDPKLDLALGFFGRNGLDVEHPAIKAAVNGDFSLLEAELASKGAQGWQQYVALAKEAHGNVVKEAKDHEDSVTAAVASTLEQFGYTNEQWGEAIDWVRKEAADEVPEINRILASGPLGAKAITSYILQNHREASGTEYAPQAKAVKEEQGANGGGQRAPVTPISKSQFAQEAEKLARSFGPDYMSSPEYKLLRQRAGVGKR